MVGIPHVKVFFNEAWTIFIVNVDPPPTFYKICNEKDLCAKNVIEKHLRLTRYAIKF